LRIWKADASDRIIHIEAPFPTATAVQTRLKLPLASLPVLQRCLTALAAREALKSPISENRPISRSFTSLTTVSGSGVLYDDDALSVASGNNSEYCENLSETSNVESNEYDNESDDYKINSSPAIITQITSDIDSNIELLYEDGHEKLRAASSIFTLATQKENIPILANHCA
jgi:hypothetical protein